MNKLLAGAMVVTTAFALSLGVLFYGAVEPEVAAPMYFLALLAAIIWAAKLLLSPASTWKSSPMHWPILAFAVYAFIRYLGAPVEYDARVELLQVGLCVLGYFTACQFYHPSHRTILLGALLVLVAFESGYALWQFATKSDAVLFWTRPEMYRGRGSGTYICPNNLAGFLELAFGLVLARGILMHRRKGSMEGFAVRRLVIFYLALMAVVGIGVSLSRGGWGATLAGLVMLAVWGDWRSRVHWWRFAAVGVGIVLLGFIAWKLAPVRIMNAITSVDRQGTASIGLGDKTLNSRRYLWRATMEIIREHPVLGTGAASWQWVHLKHKSAEVPTHPEYTHNDYLNLLSDYGAVGFALMAWVFVGFFRQAYKTSDVRIPSEERSWSVGAVVGITAILAHSLLDFNLHIPANAFALAVILGSTAAIADADGRFPRAPIPPGARIALGIGLLAVCSLLGWQFSKTVLGARYTRLGNDAKIRYLLEPGIALDFYRRASEVDRGLSIPRWKTGDIFRVQAQWRLGAEKKAERVGLARQAIPFYAEALRLNPYETQVVLRAAAADELAGDDAGALEKYNRAVAMEPNSPVPAERLGKFHRDRGNDELAAKYYDLAQRMKRVSSPGIDWNVDELKKN
ncbi:MAG: hypothetical protein QOF48_1684 [Verrucomicrobiota bacterium]|jgi:O-antigen ligase